MSRLRELVGRTQSEVVPAAALTGTSGDWSDEFDDDWDWDREWAATQETDPGTATGTPAGPAETPPSSAGAAPQRRVPRPPRRRAPLLLAVAVVGALATSLMGGLGEPTPAPVASGVDYGLGLTDASFAGGVDVEGVRGEISQVEAQARLSEIAASRAAREPDFVVPTAGRMTTCFCQRWGTMHWGLDLAAPLGTPIFAAADGVVLRAGPASGYGNAVYIQDADGNVQIYGHMRYYDVAAGDVVSAGQQIAKVGNQGQSTGPHLHFEIHRGGMNGKPIDPEAWLAERGVSVG
ncbi:M23 family metallopeptidase [Modestobacter sp. VKM Ac-2984]|uniref:M23 family metallopeptidase n=1 Tax=Modestobacter sp. VKM Ac-2984 TaxID=3004138 RepID=UPI0022AAC44C|nr:M23 family metallopeptidase [Modestobacter sp. VKM Ac-2984]MCZ2817021.1 M23 family metallopeptidase [Modestobacter sp. VKM Ac-2984]